MSKWGRAQDAVWDILYGYEMGDGTWIPGPVYEWAQRQPPREMGKLVEQIIEVVANIMCEDNRSWANPASDPPGDVKHWQNVYKKQYEDNPYPDFKDVE
jgi:hypothetical protein